jgi:leucyl-tRNA synthetase
MRRWPAHRGTDWIDLSAFEDQVDRDVRAFKFNKVVSGFMEFYNRRKHLRLDGNMARRIEEVLRVLAPMFQVGIQEAGAAQASRSLIPADRSRSL